MEYRYIPKGVCSQELIFNIEDGVVKDLKVIGGCSGNLQGISKLIVGLKIDEVIEKLRGIKCGFKSTSCPDQISRALEEYKNKMAV